MAGTGFDQMDFITCCKFAEGDSRILMLKLVRDRLHLFKKDMMSGNLKDNEEEVLCVEIAQNKRDPKKSYPLI